MTEHRTCEGCDWNDYPLCLGTKMNNGNWMKIDKMRPGFTCGQKDEEEIVDFSERVKSAEELKIEELEARIEALEP